MELLEALARNEINKRKAWCRKAGCLSTVGCFGKVGSDDVPICASTD